MPMSTICVYYPDGSNASSCRVRLGFHGFLSGMSKDAYTNSYGEANIEHSSKGKADIYVQGKKCGTFRAPGRTTVTYKP